MLQIVLRDFASNMKVTSFIHKILGPASSFTTHRELTCCFIQAFLSFAFCIRFTFGAEEAFWGISRRRRPRRRTRGGRGDVPRSGQGVGKVCWMGFVGQRRKSHQRPLQVFLKRLERSGPVGLYMEVTSTAAPAPVPLPHASLSHTCGSSSPEPHACPSSTRGCYQNVWPKRLFSDFDSDSLCLFPFALERRLATPAEPLS